MTVTLYKGNVCAGNKMSARILRDDKYSRRFSLQVFMRVQETHGATGLNFCTMKENVPHRFNDIETHLSINVRSELAWIRKHWRLNTPRFCCRAGVFAEIPGRSQVYHDWPRNVCRRQPIVPFASVEFFLAHHRQNARAVPTVPGNVQVQFGQ